jgi:sulfur-oxidizing protein SoxX
MHKSLIALLFALTLYPLPGGAQQVPPNDQAKADAAIKVAFPSAPAQWQPRLTPDETMRVCSIHHNSPPADVAKTIQQREQAIIEYPPDGKFIGDWKKGEALAQSGYGLRFTDYPPTRTNGGNCYACHQLSKVEVSYGTIGPSLLEYGRQKDFNETEAKSVYEKIYNSHASFPCSLMPRFGANQILTIDQIKDLVALLMNPDSPVNRTK